jgi:hypothetical protein
MNENLDAIGHFDNLSKYIQGERAERSGLPVGTAVVFHAIVGDGGEECCSSLVPGFGSERRVCLDCVPAQRVATSLHRPVGSTLGVPPTLPDAHRLQ